MLFCGGRWGRRGAAGHLQAGGVLGAHVDGVAAAAHDEVEAPRRWVAAADPEGLHGPPLAEDAGRDGTQELQLHGTNGQRGGVRV